MIYSPEQLTLFGDSHGEEPLPISGSGFFSERRKALLLQEAATTVEGTPRDFNPLGRAVLDNLDSRNAAILEALTR